MIKREEYKMATFRTSQKSSDRLHAVPVDLRDALGSKTTLKEVWNSLTPLARNEWICWVISAKKAETRTHRIERTLAQLLEGKRRPCCWAGCTHR